MASLVVNRGLQVIGGRASNTADGFQYISVMAFDDNATGFGATNDQLNDVGTITAEYDQALDSTPTRSAQTTTHICTIPAAQPTATSGIISIKRISLHNPATAATPGTAGDNGNVSSSTVTLCSGVDGVTFNKTADFSFAATLNYLFTSV